MTALREKSTESKTLTKSASKGTFSKASITPARKSKLTTLEVKEKKAPSTAIRPFKQAKLEEEKEPAEDLDEYLSTTNKAEITKISDLLNNKNMVEEDYLVNGPEGAERVGAFGKANEEEEKKGSS